MTSIVRTCGFESCGKLVPVTAVMYTLLEWFCMAVITFCTYMYHILNLKRENVFIEFKIPKLFV